MTSRSDLANKIKAEGVAQHLRRQRNPNWEMWRKTYVSRRPRHASEHLESPKTTEKEEDSKRWGRIPYALNKYTPIAEIDQKKQ